MPQSLPRRWAADLLARVWRAALDRPGFAVLRPGTGTDSRSLRRLMATLVGRLGDAAVAAGGERFVVERAGRFDQQVSTRFHRDGAPAASLLVLGYEPSTVRSRFFVADAHRAAADARLGIEAYLSAHNPLRPEGEARLGPYVTELSLPFGEPAIVLVNNSLMAHTPGGANPLGLLHKGVIPDPDPTARRVINSLGLMLESGPAERRLTREVVERFVARDDLD